MKVLHVQKNVHNLSCYFIWIVYHDRQTQWGQKALTVIMNQQLTSIAMGTCLEIAILKIHIGASILITV